MKTVFLVIPSYIFTSDILRTKYIKYLSSKYRVVIFTQIIDDATVVKGNYLNIENISYIKWELENPKFWSILKLLRISCIKEFDYLDSVKYYRFRPNYLRNTRRRVLRVLSWPFKHWLTTDFFSWLEIRLLPKSEKFTNLKTKYEPSLVVTATPGFNPIEAEFIIFAKKEKIPTVSMNFTWDNLTMNCEHIRKTDYMIVWNEIIKNEAINIHKYSEDKIFVSGILRFDPYFDNEIKEPTRDEFLISKGLNPKYPTILHTTVTRAYPFQKKYVHDLVCLRNSKKIPYVNLFIRLHPLDNPDNYYEFSKIPDFILEKAGHEFLDNEGKTKVEMDYNDLLNLRFSLKYSDLNVNYASTISIESFIFNKPVINIGWVGIYKFAYDFNHYRPIVMANSVRVVKKDEELPEYINMYLNNLKIDYTGRESIVEKYVGYKDGFSYKRSVDFLDVICSN